MFLRTVKKSIFLPFVAAIGLITGLGLMLLSIDDWADFKAEFKSLIHHYWYSY